MENEHKFIDLENLSAYHNCTETELGNKIDLHNNDKLAHTAMLEMINKIKSRILTVELAIGVESAVNGFTLKFNDLDKVEFDGVWNDSESKIEF